jgi:hypothetical protein
MIADVRERLLAVPFVPFVICTSEGREYSVPAADHTFVTPRGNRVVVIADDGATKVLGPLDINAIVDQQSDGAE